MDQKINLRVGQPEDEPEVEINDADLPEFLKAVERGLAQSERGEYIPGEEVFKWMESWGSENELPRPKTLKR